MNTEAAVALLALVAFAVGLIAGFVIGTSGVPGVYAEGYDEGYEDAKHGVEHCAFRRVGE